jgi:glycerophosphoryl diester phosphodiesterase
MKVIIAGSRSLTDPALIDRAMKESGFEPTEVVSGTARGADALGEAWARARGIPVKTFPADWGRLDHPGAVIRYRRDGSAYDATAGYRRNTAMAEYADALVAVWDGKSPGTRHIIQEAKRLGLKVHVFMARAKPSSNLPVGGYSVADETQTPS